MDVTSNLGSPRAVPYMVVLQMQSFYVLATLLGRVHAALCSGTMESYAYLLPRTSVVTAEQDAERLVEELKSGIEALGDSIRADTVFDGVGSMAREVEGALESMVMD
jgi:hypothetical protein